MALQSNHRERNVKKYIGELFLGRSECMMDFHSKLSMLANCDGVPLLEKR